MTIEREWSGLEIAIVGMAGRFPGAADIAAFWRNLVDGVESIRRLDVETLIALGRDEAEVRAPEFVPMHGVLDGHDLFDAEFFGYRPREAEGIDPQQRLFLEVAWEALEDAGYDPARYAGLIGVFAGSSTDHYLYEQLHRNPAALARIGAFQASFSNQPDHLATRVCYKLNLSGPGVAVQSACSTSLVAVHLACQQLLTGACDMALAGGVSLTLPKFWGYRYEEGMILSPDGHCRAFDAQAQGCLKGDGVGVVVLKRLADALADGDHIEAVILGSASNNDGAAKVGYTAPGLDGQARLIATAHALAGVQPDSIGYIEAHGTGTPLGDPIEIGALTRAFRGGTQRTGFCGIGSVKTNIGHLDAAAGITGLIKATLALKHTTLPASLHFRAPNPQLDLPATPFYVVDRTRPWPSDDAPRRAGVSSFGIGGTNAHAVLEEAPVPSAAPTPVDAPQLLLLSARSPQALAAAARRLADHLEAHAELPLADIAHTLALGRHAFAERRAVVASNRVEAITALRSGTGPTIADRARDSPPSVVFMFPGQGAQYVGMGRGLYARSALFRAQVDGCCAALMPLLGLDLRELLFHAADEAAAAAQLQQTAITQPALFVIEYSLAKTLIGLGVTPAAMVGHSLGEYVAACLADVFSLDDALRLVVERGRLMQAQPAGSMLAVPLPAAELQPLLGEGLSLAAENNSGLCVAAGPTEAIDALAACLESEHGVQATVLHTSHAFHSAMMAPAVAPFLDVLAGVPRRPPLRRFVSTVTGGWADADMLADAQHWARNIRDSVRFATALDTLFGIDDVLLLEVGPGSTLGGLARKHATRPKALVTAGTLRHSNETIDDAAFFLGTLGRLWCAGVEIGSAWLGDAAKRRVALPTYPFQRQRYWVDPAPAQADRDGATRAIAPVLYYLPAWLRSASPPKLALEGNWAVIGPRDAIAAFADRLQAGGRSVVAIAVMSAHDWGDAWLQASAERSPDHLLLVAPAADAETSASGIPRLLRALAAQPPESALRVTLAISGASAVLGDEALVPDQSLPPAWLQVLPLELPNTRTRIVDVDAFDTATIDAVLQEAQAGDDAAWVAYRRGRRWRRSVASIEWPALAGVPKRLRQRGVYAISGGLGGMGLVLAEYLARVVQARLLLFGRSDFPAREQWSAWLADNPAEAPTSRTISRLLAIEALGAEVLVASAEVTDRAALAALCERTRARFGAINGVIHAAGVPGGGLIALQDEARVAAVLAPKVAGTGALIAAFASTELDFVVLCSSLTSFVPLIGRSEYTAANLWLDTLAQARNGAQPFTISINWDNWRETGMANAVAGGEIVGLSNAEGVAAFARALDHDEPQVLVAKRDLLATQSNAQPFVDARMTAAAGLVESTRPALAAPADASVAARGDAAHGPIERQLLELARDLLGVEHFGAHDDFFEHGGDSVVSIQLVARARRAGLALSAKQVFELKTVAALAAAIGASAPIAAAVASFEGSGSLALTPIQHWFFDLPLARRGHWNLGLTLQTPLDADPALLQECLGAVVSRHDVFRSRFVERGDLWAAAAAADAGLVFESADLSAIVDDSSLTAALERLRVRAQGAVDLQQGPLLHAVHAHCGSRPGRLFVGIHHLATDLLGLRVLAEDLDAAWRQRTRATVLPAPAGSTSWSRWTERLHAYAQGAEAGAARAHWTRLATLPPAPLPRDHAQAANRHDSAALWSTTFSATQTSALIAQVSGSSSVAGALLAALAQALREWSGHPHAWIDVEGHGRDSLADDLDVTRTVGWFTTLYPIVLAAAADPANAARQAAEALRDVPLHGLSFGLLRYLHRDPAVRAEIARLPLPEVVFLYQGQRQSTATSDAALPLLGIDTDHGHAGSDLRSHLFEINAWIADGCLHVDWAYSRAVHDEATLQRLALALECALPMLGSPASAPTGPRLAPLSFAQERIWFLQQLDVGATVYNKQAVLELDGPLDRSALHGALADLIARHEPLRTRFSTRDGTPVQLIDPPVTPALHWIDLGGADAEQAEAAARARAAVCFDLATGTPFEVALLRLAAERHWLVLTLHHIVTDAWSLQVLVGELARLYSARRRGTPDPLPPLAISFADFAQWQRQWLSGATLAGLLDYWTHQLAGLAPLDLPTDRPRPPVQSFDGARVPFSWPAPLTAALRQLGRANGASPFMCLLALYKLLLHRYSGQADIVVGAPAADRPRVETEGLIGPLVNNLVLRTDLGGEPDFHTLLARVRETVLAANEHRELPFEKLVEVLNPTRDRSRSPLFQVMFAYMNVPGAAGVWDDLRVHARELEAGGAEFDLSLYAYAPGNRPDARLNGWFEYSTALFDRATIERLAGHLQQLAEAACAEPARAVATLTLLTAAERRCVVEEWNRTTVDRPPVNGVQLLFERQVQRNPDAVAAVFDDATLSYADLDRRANRLARHLRSLGIVPDDRVAICVERTSAMLVGLLAILKAGGAYVPIDPAYPADRIAHMVEDSGARVVLTQAQWLERIPASGATAICMDRDASVFETLDASPLRSVTGPEHLAYVIYTSGSTGKPKGVQLEHAAVINFVQAMMARPGLQAGDTLLAVTTISFDIHVLELFVPLAVGARIIVASHATAADAPRLRQLLDSGEISAMQATPATWRMLVDAGWAGTPRLKLLCGGEALAPDLARALLPRCAELWNLYGPTEATVWATIARITDAAAPITIGRPFDNMRAYVLGPHDQPLPVGVPGELCLGGRGVARGYLNRPELTADRFGANPFVADERIYRTGDLARWRADGCIEVLGRLDHQVKLRGHRVELGEIEAVVGAHEAIAQCVCLVREARPGDQRLVAYAIARGEARPSLAQIQQVASRKLPDYMLPAALVWLDAFPLTPNGKVDRRALPAPVHSARGPQGEAPLTPAEQFFAAIFAEVLGVESTGRYDNFFDLGGHSLLVMKVVDRVEQGSGIRMHPGELFQQTIGQLAGLYGPRLPVAHSTAQVHVERVEPVFFAGIAGSLYGCHHVPDSLPNGHAVLICAPIGHEYARCHRALRQLAAQLARRGVHVLRFDYHGCGDSDGEAQDLRLAQCRIDIASAIAELRRRSFATRVKLIGLRLGATLALQAVSAREDVSALVLWHPVTNGQALLTEWRADQREFATALGYRSDEATEQILGVPLPLELADEIVESPFDFDGGARCIDRLLIADGTDARQPVVEILAQRQAAGRPVDMLTLNDGPIWRQEPLDALVPSEALRRIVDWLELRT